MSHKINPNYNSYEYTNDCYTLVLLYLIPVFGHSNWTILIEIYHWNIEYIQHQIPETQIKRSGSKSFTYTNQ